MIPFVLNILNVLRQTRQVSHPSFKKNQLFSEFFPGMLLSKCTFVVFMIRMFGKYSIILIVRA